jgi:hypothetical protein
MATQTLKLNVKSGEKDGKNFWDRCGVLFVNTGIIGLFADFDTTSNRLGSTVKQKNQRLAEVIKGVAGLPLKFDENEGDLFGD